VSKDGPDVYRMVSYCIEVDQRISSNKSDIIDIYREKSRPEN
jgi:hypothetical protein